MERTQHQNKIFHSLLGKLSITQEEKRDMIETVTLGREVSSKFLTFEECQSLINHLNAKQGIKREYENTPENKMRRKILAICHEMHWTIDGKIDWKHLTTWLLKYGMHHKKLQDLSYEELPSQVTQFEQLLKSFYAQREIQLQSNAHRS